jgi:hypothetical protein
VFADVLARLPDEGILVW